MGRAVLVGVGVVLVAAGGVAAWRALHPQPAPPEETSLDQRPYEQTSDKEREDWMRKLGYTD